VPRYARGAVLERLVSPSRTTSTGDLRGAVFFPAIASLTSRTLSATCPVCSATAPTFFAAPDSFFDVARALLRVRSGTPGDFLFLPRPRAIPPASPASPTPAAIAGVLNCLAADVTALPALFAPLTVVSLAAPTMPLLSDDFDLLRPEDALELAVPRDGLPLRERRVLERDFAAVRPFAVELRVLERLALELRLDGLFVC
jgi:hypothetical protein